MGMALLIFPQVQKSLTTFSNFTWFHIIITFDIYILHIENMISMQIQFVSKCHNDKIEHTKRRQHFNPITVDP